MKSVWLLALAGPLAVASALLASGTAAAHPSLVSPQDEGNEPNITYRDRAGDVHVVRFVDWRVEDIRMNAGDHVVTSPGWPKAVGTPNGYSSAIDPAKPEEHVVYRTRTGHVVELWKQDYAETAWHKTDLTAAAGTKARSMGDPIGWSHDAVGRQWVVYRATNGQVHGLTWTRTTKHWKDVNLSAVARTKVRAAADPTDFMDTRGTPTGPVVVYRGTDKHVHLLLWKVGVSAMAWSDRDVSVLSHWTGVPYGRPYGWSSKPPATERAVLDVTVRTGADHVEQLYGRFGGPWAHRDLTVASSATVTATSDIQGTAGEDDFVRVQYLASDHQLHRVVLPADLEGRPTDVALFAATRVGLWLPETDSGYTAYLDRGHLWVWQETWIQPGISIALDLTAAYAAPAYLHPAPGTGTGGYFTPEP